MNLLLCDARRLPEDAEIFLVGGDERFSFV